MDKHLISRRRALLAGAAASAAGGAFLSFGVSAQGRTQLNMQLGWILGGNQLGEVCAKHAGLYEKEGIDFHFQAGGPNIDGVAIVASGRYEVGQVSSSPSIMLAVSQDIPIKCFAVGAQQHPYAFFSLQKNPIREPKDLVGKKVGIQATGVILLRALLAKNNIPEKDVTVIPIGAEMTPLMTGQVDTVTGWVTNTSALKVLGPDPVAMRLWDTGVQLYALPYYATTQTLQTRSAELAKFLSATGKGWEYAYANQDKAVDYLIQEFPSLVRADEIEAAKSMLTFSFNANTKANGWGAMDPKVWQDQIDVYAKLGQFSNRVPKVDEVMTLDVLKATDAARPRIG
ncbi:MAG: ABC transporter substrate-binding protein [Alphaproteobacteria bacterium]|nr:ABC transporter substrate-binding protein [Alphaproteobacteria bacterium]